LAGCRRRVEHPAFAVPIRSIDAVEEECVKVR
jgi:hypothetical protein